MAGEPEWERIQKKTFTKWCNQHLGKRFGADSQIDNIVSAWGNGVPLMKLAVALYSENEKNPEQAVSMPKLKANELKDKLSRIQQVSNCNKALALLTQAGVNLKHIQAENLIDEDKVNILGMVWIIILDYASRGFGGSSAEVKRALLEWVNKKTDGYERVNPPGVKNFKGDWRSGLAWCALIHRHRPELIDYNKCLTQSNLENLEEAFSIAEEHLDIPRLLEPSDVDTKDADEKSIMTYVLEYFHRFAGEGGKEAAAAQAAEWLQFIRQLRDLQNDYERRATIFSTWMDETKQGWSGYDFGSTQTEAKQAFSNLRTFIGEEKPAREMEKMDLEALFQEIQTTLVVNGLSRYNPPAHLEPTALEEQFASLNQAQSDHGRGVREANDKFIGKKDDAAAAEIIADIEASFKRYDANGSGDLNKEEFNAACMEMGIALKTQEEKDALFDKVAGGGADTISFDAYRSWMESRMVMKMDDPASVKAAFQAIADGAGGLTAAQLATKPLTDEDRDFLMANMQQDENGLYDYSAFVDSMMGI
jgi:Ca2+-binding EF-hand superfamily protein